MRRAASVRQLVKVDARGRPLKDAFRVLKDASVLNLEPGARVSLEPARA